MIPYKDLLELQGDPVLIDRVSGALIISARAKAIEANPTTEEKAWVRKVLGNPTREGKVALIFVLADHSTEATQADVQALTDAQLQTSTDLAVPALVG